MMFLDDDMPTPVLSKQLERIGTALSKKDTALACMPRFLPADLASAVMHFVYTHNRPPYDEDYTGLSINEIAESMVDHELIGERSSFNALDPFIAGYLDQAGNQPRPMSKKQLFEVGHITAFLPSACTFSRAQERDWRYFLNEEPETSKTLSDVVRSNDPRALLTYMNQMLYAHVQATPDLKERYMKLSGPEPEFTIKERVR